MANIIEMKAQNIYYENLEGDIKQVTVPVEKRLTLKGAETLLKEQGIDCTIVLRVLARRVKLELSQENFETLLVSNEPFYKEAESEVE